VRKADAASVRRAALDRMPKRAQPDTLPENNPAWNSQTAFGTNIELTGSREALHAAMTKGGDQANSMIDNWILEMRISGMRHAQIAERLGPPETEESVAQRLSAMLHRMERITTTEMKMLQTARLEGLISMCWDLARQGSVEHIELLTKIIERLNKVYELESEKGRIQLDYISVGQEEILSKTVDHAVAAVVNVYERILKQAGLLPPDREVIDGTVGDALEEAHQVITTARETPMELERKGGEMIRVR
jgi:hypothetical protein